MVPRSVRPVWTIGAVAVGACSLDTDAGGELYGAGRGGSGAAAAAGGVAGLAGSGAGGGGALAGQGGAGGTGGSTGDPCNGVDCTPGQCVASGSGAECACEAGYEAAGMTCVDIDECAGTICGTLGCSNSPGGYECLPITCAQIWQANPVAQSGNYTLYADGLAAQPWQAYCQAGTPTPTAYLNLSGENFSAFSRLGGVTTTRFTRVRIDEMTLRLAANDYTHATFTGTAYYPWSNQNVTKVPFGATLACSGDASESRVDLTGTGLQLDQAQCRSSAPSHATGTTWVGTVMSASSVCRWASLQDCGPDAQGSELVKDTAYSIQLRYGP